MTRGTLTNKTTGQKLTGDADFDDFDGDGGWVYLRIDGCTSVNSFRMTEWDFEAVKPSPYEQFQAFPVGTTFRTKRVRDDLFQNRNGEIVGQFWVKTSISMAMYVNSLGRSSGSRGSHVVDEGYFGEGVELIPLNGDN